MELSKDTILAWRSFTANPAFSDGVAYLRRVCAPNMSGKTEGDLLKAALGLQSYHEALDDLTKVLTNLPVKEKSIDQPSLRE